MSRNLGILHIVSSMNRGGIETWLMGIFRRADRNELRQDFLLQTFRVSTFDDEIRKKGGKIFKCLHIRILPLYIFNFFRILRSQRGIDAIHCHLDLGGLEIFMSSVAGVRTRIAHSHNDFAPAVRDNPWLRLKFRASHWLTRRFATHGIATSGPAAAWMFGLGWESDPRWRVIPCGIEVERFVSTPETGSLRGTLGISSDSRVIGHVGRFEAQKNHEFILRVFKAFLSLEPKGHLILVGAGKLLPRVKDLAERLGISNRITFHPATSHVDSLMKNAMDAFLFPSVFEGLGMALIEAQTMGLRCVFTDSLPEEASVMPELRPRMPLDAPVEEWAKALADAVQGGARLEANAIRQRLSESDFDISKSFQSLREFYACALKGR